MKSDDVHSFFCMFTRKTGMKLRKVPDPCIKRFVNGLFFKSQGSPGRMATQR
jgi:hypothetical protein